MKSIFLSSLLCSGAYAFPFVIDAPGVDSSMLKEGRRVRRQQPGAGLASAADCPFNPNHVPAAPITAEFPYSNATNGLPGSGKGGYQVPAPGDTAHEFRAPNRTTDIRGPCPGLNVAANHGFIARDGITTFTELVDAQQNMYNVGYDLALLLALLGLTLADGDIVTEKLSIGCDATSRTSFAPLLTGSEPGLNGHNKFEADSSLTRNDYFVSDGDDFSFNATLFGMMVASTKGNFSLESLAQYRYERYQQSLTNNPNFYFGPLSLLLYGAASFLYELMPSGTTNYTADLATISSFFGAAPSPADDGTFIFTNEERLPANWTNRVDAYDNAKVTSNIAAMYNLHPVPFGGNTANGTFALVNFAAIEQGKLVLGVDLETTTCLLYQLATQSVPSSLNSIITPTVEVLEFVLGKLTGGGFENLGCPMPLTR